MDYALAGIDQYRVLAKSGVFAGGFKTRSTFMLAASDEEKEVLERHVAALVGAGVKVDHMRATEIRSRFSVLSDKVCAGAEVHDEGHAIGYDIAHRLLDAAGIVVERDCKVESLAYDSTGQRIVGLNTDQGSVHASAVVVTAGGGSARLLGLDGLLIPRKGQLLVTERASALNRSLGGAIMSCGYLLSKGSQKAPGSDTVGSRGFGLVIDPLLTGQFLIGGSREEDDNAATNDLSAVCHILTSAISLLPGLANVRLLRAFAGVRTAVRDGLPLIGRMWNAENLYVGTGFEGDGICLGPITGRVLAEMICGKEPVVDISAFDPARFRREGQAA